MDNILSLDKESLNYQDKVISLACGKEQCLGIISLNAHSVLEYYQSTTGK
jgi:hypothetical protein